MKTKINALKIRYEKLSKTNLEITIKMESPVAFMDFLHLDSILAYLVVLKRLKLDTQNVPLQNKKEIFDIPLPIEEIGEKYKYYKASIGIMQSILKKQVWKKRIDDIGIEYIDFSNKKAQFDIGTGWSKNYQMPLIYNAILDNIVFYCVGNKEEITYLLKDLKFLGSKNSIGFGWINNIILKEIVEDNSCWCGGFPMRIIPLEEAKIQQDVVCCIQNSRYKPPYYLKIDKIPCYVPKFDIGAMIER